MNTQWPHRLLANRWLFVALISLVGLQFSAAPAVAQDGTSSANQETIKKKKQVQSMFNEGKKAAQSGNYEQAAQTFEEALALAKEAEWDQAIQMSQQFLVKSLTQAGTTANKQENYGQAVSYYDRVLQYTDNNPSVHYNRGIALLGADSTNTGLQSLQRAIELGNETGNTRVSGLATERIRSEFLARASEALQGENPSQEQINTALDALDQMREYVDPSAKSMFYRALALFQGSQHEQAIQTAREGLDMHQGSRSDAAKFYYVIGESQFELGSKADACQTFENAAYGDYEARANHYLENECDDL